MTAFPSEKVYVEKKGVWFYLCDAREGFKKMIPPYTMSKNKNKVIGLASLVNKGELNPWRLRSNLDEGMA